MISLMNRYSRTNRVARNMITAIVKENTIQLSLRFRCNDARFSPDRSDISENNVNVASMVIEITVIATN